MLVPKLRFKREDGTSYPEWENTSLGETCSGFEYGMNTAACNFDGVHQYIRITDIDDTSRRYMSENAVSPNGKMQDKYIVNVNDILFARTGASVGKAYLYRECDGLLYYAGFLIRANTNEHNNAYFVFSQTFTSNYWNWVKLTSMRTGQQGINAQEYKEYKFFSPCLEEQQKIADFLSTVDEVISQSEAEVKALEQSKKAMMQRIFSREVRFKREDGTDYPEWEEKTIKDCLTYEQPTKYIVTSDRYDDKHNTPVLTANKGFILGYTDETDGVYNKGAVVIYDDFTMDMKYVNFPFKVKSSAMKMLTAKDNYDLYFMYSLLLSLKLHTEVHSRTYISVVEPMSIQTPCLEEQQKIADFFSAYDEAITYAKAELNKWKELKKGLLQQMFV